MSSINDLDLAVDTPFMSDYRGVLNWRIRCIGYLYHSVVGRETLDFVMDKIFGIERFSIAEDHETSSEKEALQYSNLARAEKFYREGGVMESLEMLNIFSGFDLEILSSIPLLNKNAKTILSTSNPTDVMLTLWRYHQGLQRPLAFHGSTNELPWREETRNSFHVADFVLRFGLLTQCGKQFSLDIYPEHNVYFLNNPFKFVKNSSFYKNSKESDVIYPPRNFWDDIIEFEPEYYLERMHGSGYFPPEFLVEFEKFLSNRKGDVHALEGLVDLRETMMFEPDSYYYREPYNHGEPKFGLLAEFNTFRV